MSDHIEKGTVIFDQVSKRYRLGTLGTLRGTVSALLSRRRDGDDSQRVLWALRDVSFRVEPGESLGLIGPNGAGKTTALKLLSNITQPTAGRITVDGRVSTLIELGAGFHPELTGRENIYLNGAILGLRRREIDRKLDAIVAFSELERFIDTPVKRYSSGMYVRLGFAVAAHVEPDVLLVDEVLAVGDAEFRQRCMARMKELRVSGTTIIFVSHNMHMVRSLCDHALLLWRGQVHFEGSPNDAIVAYEQMWQKRATQSSNVYTQEEHAPILISKIQLLNSEGMPRREFCHGESLEIRFLFVASYPIESPVVRARLVAEDGPVAAMVSTLHQRRVKDIVWTLQGEGEIAIVIPSLEVVTGSYSVEVRVLDTTDSEVLASMQSDQFFVQAPGLAHEVDRGIYMPDVTWILPRPEKQQ